MVKTVHLPREEWPWMYLLCGEIEREGGGARRRREGEWSGGEGRGSSQVEKGGGMVRWRREGEWSGGERRERGQVEKGGGGRTYIRKRLTEGEGWSKLSVISDCTQKQ